jgi:hypothetical protein
MEQQRGRGEGKPQLKFKRGPESQGSQKELEITWLDPNGNI